MKKEIILSIVSIFFLLTSCGNNTNMGAKDRVGSFSYKNGNVAFTYFKKNVGSIYYTTNIDSVAQQLTFPKKGWDFTLNLSKDLSKILYINYPKASYEICNICLYDLQSKKTDTVIKHGKFITDACISNDNKFVYYLNASEIKNYSPIASRAPHGIDIYKINIETKKVQKLTNWNAYSIQALTMSSSDTIIGVNCYDKNGLVMISTKTGKFKELNINSPRNNPVKQHLFPIDIRADSIMYVAPCELYKHNLKTDKSEFILSSPFGQFGVIQPDNNWKNILFRDDEKMYLYNVPNKKLKEVKLRIE